MVFGSSLGKAQAHVRQRYRAERTGRRRAPRCRCLQGRMRAACIRTPEGTHRCACASARGSRRDCVRRCVRDRRAAEGLGRGRGRYFNACSDDEDAIAKGDGSKAQHERPQLRGAKRRRRSGEGAAECEEVPAQIGFGARASRCQHHRIGTDGFNGSEAMADNIHRGRRQASDAVTQGAAYVRMTSSESLRVRL